MVGIYFNNLVNDHQAIVRRKHKRRDEVIDQHVSLLLSCGLLTRHLTQKDTYWFALAGIGPLIKSVTKGRKVTSCYLVSAIAHKRSASNELRAALGKGARIMVPNGVSIFM